MNEMQRFEQEFEDAGGRFIAPLRVAKKLDRAAYDGLLDLTRKGQRLLTGQDEVSKTLVAKALYVYLTTTTQASYAEDRDAIQQAATVYLDHVFEMFAREWARGAGPDLDATRGSP